MTGRGGTHEKLYKTLSSFSQSSGEALLHGNCLGNIKLKMSWRGVGSEHEALH